MIWIATILAAILLWSTPVAAVQVKNVRTWPAPDHTRVVFDIDSTVTYNVFLLDGPDRVVIDMKHTRLATDIRRPSRSDKLLRRIRSAPRKYGSLRVVLDLKHPIRPRSFLLDPNKQYGHRLVVDLYPKTTNARDKVVENNSASQAADGLRDVVVAVDAGHGGDDPGAVPRKGVHEKDVVLAIARELERVVGGKEGMRAILIRNGDYYVGLRRRMELARQAGADLFVSVHADAFRDPGVHGASVYVVSRRGASSEAARWLATQENSADLAGGVSLDDKEEGLATVLLDLSQTASLRASRELGRRVLSRLGRIGPLHKRRVERAGFMVLKAPDIPSILVETGFITNSRDERRLMDPVQRRAIAGAIAEGIAGYFEVHAPAGTLLAKRRHVIARGDTLSEIAKRYRVSLAALRSVNRIRGDRIHIGDVLRIPEG